MKKIVLTLALGLATANAYATTPPAPLWQTGQIQCYDASNNPVACSVAEKGQDGAVQAGAAWDIATRFEVNGDVVTDTLTGLQWQQDPSVNNSGNTLRWKTALNTCNDLDQGGQTDWRLPNRTELNSLVDLAAANPAGALNDNGFVSVNERASVYWSSSTYALSTGFAWVVDFGDGSVYDVGKRDDYRAWCVRSGL